MSMFGQNPIRPPVNGTGEILDIQEIFATFQGEGPYVGWPAVFIRLGGCNLACSFCDTEFEQFSSLPLPDILAKVTQLAVDSTGKRLRSLIVITGGEPLRQPIEKLCKLLIINNFTVQIETNGTLFRDLDPQVNIVCSPKNTGTGYHPIRPDLLARISVFKFLISCYNDKYQAVPDWTGDIPVYIQPMDEQDEHKNQCNLQHTVSMAREHGYRISIQLHKIAGVP